MKKILILILLASCTKASQESLSVNASKKYACWANIPTTGATMKFDTTVNLNGTYIDDGNGNKGYCNCEGK